MDFGRREYSSDRRRGPHSLPTNPTYWNAPPPQKDKLTEDVDAKRRKRCTEDEEGRMLAREENIAGLRHGCCLHSELFRLVMNCQSCSSNLMSLQTCTSNAEVWPLMPKETTRKEKEPPSRRMSSRSEASLLPPLLPPIQTKSAWKGAKNPTKSLASGRNLIALPVQRRHQKSDTTRKLTQRSIDTFLRKLVNVNKSDNGAWVLSVWIRQLLYQILDEAYRVSRIH